MKKIICMAALIFAALTLTSCGDDPAKRAEDYGYQSLELVKKGDRSGMAKLSEEIDDYCSNLSEDDRKKFDEASRQFAIDHIPEFMNAATEHTAGLIKAGGETAAGILKAVSDDKLNENLDDLDDKLDDAIDEISGALDALGNE